MDNYSEHNSDQISIGEMAELFNISGRTLRLYHDMGLLVPQYINDKNGYRYYSRSQFQRLEKIIQMKSVGLSLKQIKSMLNERNLSVFEALLSERIDQLTERIAEDSAARDLLVKQLSSCARLRNPPVLDSAFIEFIPKRPAFAFDIDAYDLRQSYQGGSPWERALTTIKAALIADNLPTSLLSQACCSITQQALMDGKFVCSGAMLLADGPLPASTPHRIVQSVIQAGTYACMYRNYVAMDGRSECIGLEKLLQFIRDNHYQVVGPYLGEVVAKMSIFDYSNNNILVKLQIPVKISE
jgi:DNA-binding transcriptional MerR regulator/effector-binding domain-containing protein